MLSWNHASHNANLSKLESYTNKNNGRHLWAYSTNKPSSFRGPDRAGGCKQLRRMDVQFHWYSFLKITSNKQQPFNHAWSSKRWNQLKSNKHVPDHVPDKEMRLDDRLRGERCCVFWLRFLYQVRFWWYLSGGKWSVPHLMATEPRAATSIPFSNKTQSLHFFDPNMSCHGYPIIWKHGTSKSNDLSSFWLKSWP